MYCSPFKLQTRYHINKQVHCTEEIEIEIEIIEKHF